MIDDKKKVYRWGTLIFITIVVGIRLFWGITEDCFTFLDEYPTFASAVGFHKTGHFVVWDFVENHLGTRAYTRAWPHSAILAAWFAVFGDTVVAGKVLSAVFGLLFAWSLYYVTMRIFHRPLLSFMAEIIVFTNSDVCISFRQIRMYGPWMLCMLWVMYFSYRMMTEKMSERITEKGNALFQTLSTYWSTRLDFSPFYILSFLGIFLLSQQLHINTLLITLGMFPFLIYLLIAKRERRYVTALVLLLMLVLSTILYIGIKGPDNWITANAMYAFAGDGSWIRTEMNERYWTWLCEFTHSTKLMALLCASAAIGGVRTIRLRKNDRSIDFIVYCLLITLTSLLLFLFVLDRYYQARYMLYVAIPIAIIMAWGVSECVDLLSMIASFRWSKQLFSALAVCILLALCGRSMFLQFETVYDDPKITRHIAAYEALRVDAKRWLDGQKIPLIACDFQGYYANQILDEYDVVEMDRVNDYPRWIELASKCPKGYMLIETPKINGFQPGIKDFLQHYGERVAGEGIDRNNLEIVRYHMLFPEEFNGDFSQFGTVTKLDGEFTPVTEPVGDVVTGENFNSFIQIVKPETESSRVTIRLQTDRIPRTADVLFARYGVDNSAAQYGVQLVIPPRYTGVLTYHLDVQTTQMLSFDDLYEVHCGQYYE